MYMSQYYLITYKIQRNYPIPQAHEYDSCHMILKKKGEILHYSLEHDSKGKLHFHCLYKTIRNTFMKNFMIHGMHLHFLPIDDDQEALNNVINYIHKEQSYQSAREQYLFDDGYDVSK